MELSVPQGYHSTGNGVVARLRRSLYGLKRAPQASSEKFRAALIKLQFLRCPYPSLFLHYTLTISKKNFFIILKPTLLYSSPCAYAYVDDTILTGTDATMIRDL